MKQPLKRITSGLLALALVFMLAQPCMVKAQAADPAPFRFFTTVQVGKPTENIDAAPIPFGDEVIARGAPVKIRLEYTIDGTVVAHTPYTFTLPEELDLSKALDINIMNQNEPGKVLAVVSVADNAGTIQFNDVAVTTGWFYISTNFNADKITNATKNITFFKDVNGGLPVALNFAATQIEGTAAISDQTATPDTATSTINWAFKATPTLKNAVAGVAGEKQLTNRTITATLAEGLAYKNATATLTDGSGNPVSATFSQVDDTLTWKIADSDYTEGEAYTVSYQTTYAIDSFTDTSTAKFTNNAAFDFDYPQYDNVSGGTKGITALGAAKKASASGPKEAEVTANYLEKSFDQTAIDEITWTVKVNSAKTAFTDPVTVTDVLPEGLTLKTGSVMLDGTAIAVPAYSYTSNDAAAPYKGGTLAVPDLSGISEHTITYITQVDPKTWQTQPTASYTNGVSYTGVYNGKGYGFSRTKTGEARFGGGSTGGLIAASGKYDPTDHSITWAIAVNSMKYALDNGKLDIVIPAGLSYDGVTLSEALNTTNTTVSGTGPIEVTLPRTLNSEGVITLRTLVKDENIWATNKGDTKLSGAEAVSAKLTANPGIQLTANPSVTATSKVVDKSFVSYDYNTKIITWSIAVDQNGMAMTSPVLTDALMKGLEYVAGSAVGSGGVTVASEAYNKSTRLLTLALSDFAKQPAPYDKNAPAITLQTKVIDEALLKPPAGDTVAPSAKITNNASLTFKEIEGKVAQVPSASTGSTVGSRPLVKRGESNDKFRLYTWTVDVNPNQIAQPAGLTIVDELPKGLLMDMGSVKLYKANVNHSTGALTKGDLVGAEEYTASLTGQTLKITLKNAFSNAYQLVFETDNLNVLSGSYNNKIYFDGDTGTESSSGDLTQGAAGGGGAGNPNRGSIKLTATKKDGTTPLSGVTYTLTGTNPYNVYTFTTGADGVALFNPVKLDTYTVTVQLPAGWGALASPPSFTLMAGGSRDFANKQTYDNGATVTLRYDANAQGEPVTGAAPLPQSYATGAAPAVLANPFDRPGFVFVKWNTQANGQGTDYAPADALTITADTTLYAIWREAVGSVAITAKSDDVAPVLFNGLDYCITDAAGANEYRAITNLLGEAEFRAVRLGEYTIDQPLPRPAGYIPLTVGTLPKLELDGDHAQAEIVYTKGYALVYNGNGSTSGMGATQYQAEGATASVLDNPFGRPGYRFKGWNTSSDGTGTAYQAGASIQLSADITLYAMWEQVQESTAAKPGSPAGVQTPKTGDSFPLIGVWVVAILSLTLGALCLVSAGHSKKRRAQK